MTREELTARLRKLTGKTATDIEALDERVDALEAGGSGGGVEFNTLDVTVTFSGYNHTFTGVITSEIPENTVINDIIKIESVVVSTIGQETITTYEPLPKMEGQYDSSNSNIIIGAVEAFGKIDPVPEVMGDMPLGIIFTRVDVHMDSTEFTKTYKITYV